MKKELKDYLHLYIGSKVWTTHLALNNGEPQALTVSINNLFDILYKYHDSKLILRPLSSMTEDDVKEENLEISDLFYEIIPSHRKRGYFYFTANQVHWLLSRGFDLFGLIDSGLAVNAETLK